MDSLLHFLFTDFSWKPQPNFPFSRIFLAYHLPFVQCGTMACSKLVTSMTNVERCHSYEKRATNIVSLRVTANKCSWEKCVLYSIARSISDTLSICSAKKPRPNTRNTKRETTKLNRKKNINKMFVWLNRRICLRIFKCLFSYH